MYLLAAISLGFLGSFHCIGMCGPIALSIPVKRNTRWSFFGGSLVYNSGRMLSYAAMGLLFGLVGQGFAIAGWQSALSIALGVLILVLLFLPAGLVRKVSPLQWFTRLRAALQKLFGVHTTRSLLIIGLLNGLLPCGLVYMGIAGALATGGALQGALFMAAFGLGTFPAMLAVGMARNHISIRMRERIRKAMPVFIAGMALLLILRGMGLGIPYLSPSIEKNSCGGMHHQCCNK